MPIIVDGKTVKSIVDQNGRRIIKVYVRKTENGQTVYRQVYSDESEVNAD